MLDDRQSALPVNAPEADAMEIERLFWQRNNAIFNLHILMRSWSMVHRTSCLGPTLRSSVDLESIKKLETAMQEELYCIRKAEDGMMALETQRFNTGD